MARETFGNGYRGAPRRALYRRGKRVLARLVARRWSGACGAVEPAVRRFLAGRTRDYLCRVAGEHRFALAAAASLLAAGAAAALPPVSLSDVAGGVGGFLMSGDPGDHSGYSVSGAGDVNGDGLADLVVGAPDAGPGGAGRSYVVFGKADGTAVDLADVAAGSGGFAINGIGAGDYSGMVVSGAGDVNGDGLGDLIVGGPYADAGGNFNAGESYVIFGKAGGTAVDLADVAAGDGGFVINGIDPGDYSGLCVSDAGDVNGDGLADLVVGAPYAGPGDAGESYVIFGKAGGTPVNLSDVAAGAGGFVIKGDPGDLSGYSVSGAGDVNGDGLSDLIVGAPDAGPGGAGESSVVFGKADGAAVDLAEVAAGDGGFVINGSDAGDYSGLSVSGAGDVNGDGLGDLIVGAAYADAGGNSNAGESSVVFGKADGAAVDLADVAAGSGGFVINGSDAGDYSGLSVSGAGDVNGDGLSDLVVGAPYADAGGDSNAGESSVVFGKSDGAAVDLADVAAGDGGFVINGIDAGDSSGLAVSGAGDVDGDGLGDLIVGAPDAGSGAAGESYVVFSPVTRGDLDGDASVGIADLLMLLGSWGPCSLPCPPSCPGDLDRDCAIGIADLLALLAGWS